MDIWGFLCSSYSSRQCLNLHVRPAPFSLWLVDEEIYLRQIRGTASTRITAGPSRSSSPPSNLHFWEIWTVPSVLPLRVMLDSIACCQGAVQKTRVFSTCKGDFLSITCQSLICILCACQFFWLLPHCLHRQLVLSDSFKLKGSSVPGVHCPLLHSTSFCLKP